MTYGVHTNWSLTPICKINFSKFGKKIHRNVDRDSIVHIEIRFLCGVSTISIQINIKIVNLSSTYNTQNAVINLKPER